MTTPLLILSEHSVQEWLNNDNLPNEYHLDYNKRMILKKLNKLKEDFRSEYYSPISLPSTPQFTISYVVNNLIGKVHQIEKLRLMLSETFYVVSNFHKSTGKNYIVVRANWLDNRGNKFKMFSKNIGLEQKVMSGGKVPDWKLTEVKNHIRELMKLQYEHEYGERID